MTLQDKLIMVREARAKGIEDTVHHIRFALKTGHDIEQALKSAELLVGHSLGVANDLRSIGAPRLGYSAETIKTEIESLTRVRAGA